MLKYYFANGLLFDFYREIKSLSAKQTMSSLRPSEYLYYYNNVAYIIIYKNNYFYTSNNKHYYYHY